MKTGTHLTIFLCLFFLGFLLLPWSKAEGVNFYVDGSNGDDSWDGLSWASANKTVSAAISAANATGETDTIRVAAGTYVENVVITTPEILLGGYPVGGGERDWEANATILDGARLGSVVWIKGNGFGTVVDGFTVTNGYNGPDGIGGGVLICDSPYPENAPQTVIQNCTITGNEASKGGGIFTYEVDTRILNNRIIGNIALGSPAQGGGIAVFQKKHAGVFIIEGNTISDNLTQFEVFPMGGGIVISDIQDTDTENPEPRVFVRNNVIRHNQVCGVRVGCCASLENNEISENLGDGVVTGPVTWTGGGIWPVWRVEVSNNTIAGNTEYGVHAVFGFVRTDISRSIFWGNLATSYPFLQDRHNFVYSLTQDVQSGEGNLSTDPLFVPGPEGDYYLSQVAAGQANDSPAVDSGGISAVEAGVEFRSTRTDGVRDTGVADRGFHYPPSSFNIFRGTDPANLPAYVTGIQLPYTDTGARTDLSFPLLFYRVDTDRAIVLRPSGTDLEILYFPDRS
jgi:hypothetical protein